MNDQYAARNSSREPESPEEEGKTSPKRAEKTEEYVVVLMYFLTKINTEVYIVLRGECRCNICRAREQAAGKEL